MKAFWDERYGSEDAVYGREPNAFLKEQLADLTPGTILLPCDGEGRNALYAAQQGWEVHSFDYSDEGVAKSLRWASEAGVTVNACVADAFAFEPGQGFDAVALIYAHMPADRRADFHARAIQWLKPGGTLILEGFNPDQLGNPSGGPKALDMLFTEDMLRADFAGLDFQLCQTAHTTLNEGAYHRGPADVIRLIATRPLEA